MRTALRAAVIAAALLMTGQPAHAQGFLKRLAERAVTRAEQGAERIVEDAGRRDEAASTPTGSPRTARGSEPVQPGVLTPRAVRGSAPRGATPAAVSAPAPAKAARYAADLSAPPEAEAAKVAYNAFGEVRCSDCEGGIDFDGLPKFSSDQFSGQWAERAKRIGNWPLSHVRRWQGIGGNADRRRGGDDWRSPLQAASVPAGQEKSLC
jgi:hypothetical protein